MLEEINGAKRRAEGRGVRLKVTLPRDLVAIKTLADIKLERT